MSAGTPEMDLFGKIRMEHQKILGKIDELVGSSPEVQHEKINELLLQIIAHLDAEERTIYRTFKDLETETRMIAVQNEEEHQVTRYLVSGLKATGVAEEHWWARLKVLQNVFKGHIAFEEHVMFDRALDHFTQEEINDMAMQFDRVKTELVEKSRAILG